MGYKKDLEVDDLPNAQLMSKRFPLSFSLSFSDDENLEDNVDDDEEDHYDGDIN